MTTFRTLAEVRTSLLARLGNVDDGANNPALTTMADEAINGALVQLVDQMPWLVREARGVVNWNAGESQNQLPPNVLPERIVAADYVTTEITYPLKAGIPVPDENRYEGVPEFYQAQYEYRATGVAPGDADLRTAYVVLDPYPTEGGELHVRFRWAADRLTDDAAIVPIDNELVILQAASELSATIAPHLHKHMLAQYKSHYRQTRALQSNGSGFTLLGRKSRHNDDDRMRRRRRRF